MESRNHALLHGEPDCGKSTLALKFAWQTQGAFEAVVFQLCGQRPVTLRPAIQKGRWADWFVREKGVIVVHGETVDARNLPALIAGEQQGLATYQIRRTND